MHGLENLLSDIAQCRLCAVTLPHDPRPILQAASQARLVVAAQAPA